MSTNHHQPVEVVDGVYLCDKCGELGHKALDQMAVCGSSGTAVTIRRFVDLVEDGIDEDGARRVKQGAKRTVITIGRQSITIPWSEQGARGSGGLVDQLADLLRPWGTKK